jgi:sugar O-acyltransferase (sialic acid O-acetyltransferase NeuD family)
MMNPTPEASATPLGELLILGAGGHAAVVAESAERAGWRVIGCAAGSGTLPMTAFNLGDPDDAGAAGIDEAVARGVRLHAAVGSAEVRARWMQRFGAAAFATVVDPSSSVSPSAAVAEGASIGVGAVVQARAVIGPGAIVNTRAVVEHDCTVGACAHIAPAAVLCGSVTVGAWAQVGAGAVVIPGRSIGERTVIGAGAVVVRDLPADITAMGVPARATAPSPTR